MAKVTHDKFVEALLVRILANLEYQSWVMRPPGNDKDDVQDAVTEIARRISRLPSIVEGKDNE